ncbi:MAG: bacteriocin-protection protein [Chloroflexota bacterium]|nr:MAG: bacteriocin-protection protein [Chloroflexota bacterium]
MGVESETDAVFFETAAAFWAWLAQNHASTRELWVGYHRKHTGRPSIDWPQSVDQALCFGWIDGIRRRVDDGRFKIRFTPRKRSSNWSAVNIRRVAELETLGLMHPAGRAAFAARQEARSGTYSYEQRPADLPEEYAAGMRSDAQAWAFWQAQPPSYRKTATWWIVSAKREETRVKRLAMLIEHCARGRRFTQFAAS